MTAVSNSAYPFRLQHDPTDPGGNFVRKGISLSEYKQINGMSARK